MIDAVRSAIRGEEQADRLITSFAAGQSLPDALHTKLQEIRSFGDGDHLRAFTRRIQKALEAAPKEKS